ncbi:hypothetical protein SAMD00023353_4500130 [Rosellinia necatrix]|uniref:Uncharacterized protein n=1 Tax=Rosellinia necatrix TaxID=77044 RepID=A0A1W2TPU3_ROSNE|nr:hypothetical protein SAMD00023353_4500130 [Rosellinia necatrix]
MRQGTMIRLKIPVTPVQAKSRRDSDSLSSLDLSDESGYSAVEDITGSDDDEEDVEAAEEEHILSDEMQHVPRSSPRPDQDDEDDDDEDDDEALGDDEGEEDDVDDSASWDGFPSEPEQVEIDGPVDVQIPTIQRRVRFDVPDSDDDDDDTETDEDTAYGFFPDLFVDKSKLDPSFRLEVDQNSDDDSEAYWDHYGTANSIGAVFEEESSDFEALINAVEEDDTTPVATPMTQNDTPTTLSTPVASPEKDDVSLDGYQSDGDTTDEEEPVPRPVRRRTRRDPAEEGSEASDVEIIKGRRGHPRVGRFSLDKSSKKPVAMVNPKTGKLMIFTTPRSLKRGLDLSPEQFNFPFFDPPQSSPVLGNPGNIMMSGMISSNTFGDFMNTHAVGPAEAWYAQLPDSNVYGDSSGSEDQAVDDEEKNLRIEDFLDIEDDSDLSDRQEIDRDDGDEILCTPARPTTSSSDVTSLLDHFEHNSNLVGAFRRDQAHHRLITRSKATHDSLAFSGPYFEGTLRGIKDGRIATANVPISPLRKRKKVPEFASSPLSAPTKRKASSENRTNHKRQRSLPDVGPLHL